MITQISMVAGQHKDGVLEPGLPAGALEELADGHVGIADAFMNDDALFGIEEADNP